VAKVYERTVWTIIEDPANLNGADVAETSKTFFE
jgi:hypothetical protein